MLLPYGEKKKINIPLFAVKIPRHDSVVSRNLDVTHLHFANRGGKILLLNQQKLRVIFLIYDFYNESLYCVFC